MYRGSGSSYDRYDLCLLLCIGEVWFLRRMTTMSIPPFERALMSVLAFDLKGSNLELGWLFKRYQ